MLICSCSTGITFDFRLMYMCLSAPSFRINSIQNLNSIAIANQYQIIKHKKQIRFRIFKWHKRSSKLAQLQFFWSSVNTIKIEWFVIFMLSFFYNNKIDGKINVSSRMIRMLFKTKGFFHELIPKLTYPVSNMKYT